MVRDPCASIGGAVRAGPPVHRRTALGVAADVVARRLRERRAALRTEVRRDQPARAHAGPPRRRSDRVSARLTLLGAVALAVIALVACTTPPPPPPTTEGVGLKANFILANPAGLLAMDDRGEAIGRIIDLPAQSAPATPALHPSRKSAVFALTQQPNKKTGFGSDLFSVNLDGTGFRPVVEHEADNVFYASPRFDSTGNLLYFHRRAAIITGGSFIGNEDGIFRLDLRSGERKQVVRDGADPALSPDGTWIVYVHLMQGQPAGLWRAKLGGTAARPVAQHEQSRW